MEIQRIQSVIDNLLKVEAENNLGNFSSEEREEFQNYIKKVLIQKPLTFGKKTNPFIVNTPEGQLQVGKTEDKNNPGVYIELIPTGSTTPIDIAIIEYTADKKKIANYAYGDCSLDDYTYVSYLKNLEKIKTRNMLYERAE